MNVVGVELDFGDLARVLLQMRHKFAASHFPDADLALHATRAHKLVVGCEANSSDTSLVGVFDLPEQLAVVNPVCTDGAVTPARDDNFVGEDGAVGGDIAGSLADAGS